jgi:hypothetical protein
MGCRMLVQAIYDAYGVISTVARAVCLTGVLDGTGTDWLLTDGLFAFYTLPGVPL